MLFLTGIQGIYAQKDAAFSEVQEIIDRSVALEQVSLDSSLQMTTLAFEKARKLSSDSLMGKALLRTSNLYIHKGKLADAAGAVRTAISHFKKAGRSDLRHNAYYYLASLHYYERQFDSALFYFLKVRDFYQGKQNFDILAAAETGIGTHYYYYKKDYEQAASYFSSSSQMYHQLGNAEGEAGNYLFLGLCYMQRNMHDSASLYFEKSYNLARENGLPGKELEALSYQGSLLLKKGEKEEAFQKQLMALSLARKLNKNIQEARLLAGIVDIILSDTSGIPRYALEFLENEGGLINFLEKTKEWVFQYGMPFTQIQFFKYLSGYYEKTGLYKKALEYQKEYKSLSDSIQNRTKDKIIAETEERFKTAEKEKELIRKQSELALLQKKRQQELERAAAALIFLLLALASAILYARLKNSRAREAVRANELAQTTLKKELVEKELAKQSLKIKERELMAQTLTLLQKEEMIEEVRTKLEAAQSYEDMHTVRRSMQLNKLKNQDWEKFLMSFSALHPDFLKELENQSEPASLTQREKRLAALLKMGLTNREISIMLGINNASVDQAKYRLKKKLQIDADQKLEEFLSGVI